MGREDALGYSYKNEVKSAHISASIDFDRKNVLELLIRQVIDVGVCRPLLSNVSITVD